MHTLVSRPPPVIMKESEMGEPKPGESREGYYANWEWDAFRKCWAYSYPLRIYPHEDGSFTASTNEVWHPKRFESFEAAELGAFGDDEAPAAPQSMEGEW